MTLTNHTRRIEELTGDVVYHVDAREYPKAHLVLDEMQSKLFALRRHIEHLQNVTDFAARPAGGD